MNARRKLGQRWRGWPLWAAALLLMPMAWANSTFFTDTGTVCTATHPCWQPTQFGMLVGLGSAVGASGTLTATSNKGDTINGAIGIGSGSYIDNGNSNETWSGPVDFADAQGAGKQKSNGYPVPNSTNDVLKHTTISGGVTDGLSLPTTALDDVLAISNTWTTAAVGGDIKAVQSISNLGRTGGTTTIGTTAAGTYVYNVTSINTNAALSIVAGPQTVIVINDSGSANFTKGVTVSSGVNADQVLFNIEGTTGTTLTISAGGAVVAGDFIVRAAYNLSNTTLDGRVLGGWGTLTLGNAFVENAPAGMANPIPEPQDWVLLAGGFGALIWIGKRQTAARRQFPRAARVRERIEIEADAGESGECVPAAAGGTAGRCGGDGTPSPEPGIRPPGGGGRGGSSGMDLASHP